MNRGSPRRPRASLADRTASLLGAATVGLLVAGCGGYQSMLRPTGVEAARIAELWWVLFAVCSAVFVAVTGFLIFALFRRERGDRENDDATSTRWVAGGVIATLAILAFFFVYNLHVARDSSAYDGSDDAEALVVEVTGVQWWWNVVYMDSVPGNVVRTANEIHLPVGVPVRLDVKTRDVIHSFWMPNLQGKIDLVPGRTNSIWVRAEEPGVYRGQCAEFCGMQHARMAFVVVVEPYDEFQEWLEHQRQPALPPADSIAAAGQQVFLDAPCALCHQIRGTRAAATAGPDLTHLASRRTLAAGTLPNTRGNLAAWIVDPQQIKPGNHMPPVNLDSEDLQALLTFLETLR